MCFIIYIYHLFKLSIRPTSYKTKKIGHWLEIALNKIIIIKIISNNLNFSTKILKTFRAMSPHDLLYYFVIEQIKCKCFFFIAFYNTILGRSYLCRNNFTRSQHVQVLTYVLITLISTLRSFFKYI